MAAPSDVVSENFRLEAFELRRHPGRLLAVVADPRDDAAQTLRRAGVALRAMACPDDVVSLWLDAEVQRGRDAVEFLQLLWQEVPELFRMVDWRLPADLEAAATSPADVFGRAGGLSSFDAWWLAFRNSHRVRFAASGVDLERLALGDLQEGAGSAMAAFADAANQPALRAVAKSSPGEMVVVADLGDALGRRVFRECNVGRVVMSRSSRRAVAAGVATVERLGACLPGVGSRGEPEPISPQIPVVFVADAGFSVR